MKSNFRNLLTASCLALFAIGCSDKKKTVEFPPYDNTEAVEAFYKADPDRFVFATADDIPSDLKWENGSELPDIGSPKAKKGGTLKRAIPDFPRTLRPFGPDSTGGIRRYIMDDVAMLYVHRHPNVDGWYPGVAKEWAVDKKANRVFIRINPTARWSDGEAITTEDTLFSFYFRMSDDTKSPWGKNYYTKTYTNITIYDEYTFSITVADRRPDIGSLVFEGMPQPRHFYIEHGPDYVQRYQWRFIPTSGAYIIQEKDIRKGRSVALTRYKDWWAKDNKFWRNRYNPDRVELAVIRDTEKMFESFLKGDIDFFRLNLAKYWYKGLPNDAPDVQNGYLHKATFYNNIPQSTMGLWLNTSKPPLDNVNVRRGLHFATNWQLGIDKFFRGDWKRLNTTSDGYGEASRSDIVAREFSIEKALAEFGKAGFTERGPDGILKNKEGKRLSFTVSTGSKAYEDLLTILKQEAMKAGVEFKLEILEATTGWKKIQEKKHEISFAGTASSPTERYPRYWDFWHSETAFKDGKPKAQTNNFSVTGFPELDKLIDQYEKSEIHEEKIKLAHQIEGILFDHAAWIPGVDFDFFRVGYWRWLEWPDDFNVNRTEIEESHWLHWINEDKKKETLEAMKTGKKFPPVIKVYDQYKVK